VRAPLDNNQNPTLIYDLLHQATVQISTPIRSSTGFFVSHDIILTCAHVLQNTNKELIAIRQDRRKYLITSYDINLDIDVAVVRIKLDEDVKTLFPCLDISYQSEDDFCIYGYSSIVPGSSSFSAKCQTEPKLGKLISFVGKNIDEGLSGAPLLNQRTQKVCGMVRSDRTLISSNGMRLSGGDAIPISTIFKEFPELKKINYDFYYQGDSVIYNLPVKTNNEFIGRKSEIRQLLEYLSPTYRQHIIVVSGIGGIGKTALVIEAAYRCLESKQNYGDDPKTPIFEAIIFTSFRNSTTFSTHFKPLRTFLSEIGLSLILRIISDTLNQREMSQVYEEEEAERVYQLLSKQSTLLIVDGLEDVSSEKCNKILDFLSNLPLSTKAVITTREQVLLYSHIPLGFLSKKESAKLIRAQSNFKRSNITSHEIQQISQQTNGLPIALIYAMGQYAAGYSLNQILKTARYDTEGVVPEDLGKFYFDKTVEPLRKQFPHRLLMAATLFREAPCYDALVKVAGLEDDDQAVTDSLLILQQLSLLSEDRTEEVKRYRLLPLTREYALAELATISELDSTFETEARQRWIDWYRNFTEKYAANKLDNAVSSQKIEKELENIGAVLFWCANHQKYDWVKEIWNTIDSYIKGNQYWLIRLYWWQYLEVESQKRADIKTYIKALSEKSETLIFMGQKHYPEVEKSLMEAWSLRQYTDKSVQIDLENHLAVLAKSQEEHHQKQECPDDD
jgi:Trypsin-like peptidase domain/AAA ATPase domain